MFFSNIVISSGDSVAREGAMLGVPSIYAGIRDMPANEIMIRKGMLLKLEPENIIKKVLKILDNSESFTPQESFRKALFEEWDDFTTVLLNKIKEN